MKHETPNPITKHHLIYKTSPGDLHAISSSHLPILRTIIGTLDFAGYTEADTAKTVASFENDCLAVKEYYWYTDRETP